MKIYVIVYTLSEHPDCIRHESLVHLTQEAADSRVAELNNDKAVNDAGYWVMCTDKDEAPTINPMRGV